MQTYSAYGITVASSLNFPDFDATNRAPDWGFSVTSELPSGDGVEVGLEMLDDGAVLRVFKLGDSIRLDVPQLGSFTLDPSVRSIGWFVGSHDCQSCARHLMINRVLPIAAHLSGILTLHGSAVVVDGIGLAFLAPKHSGKSTLATALLEAGATLASDDCVPVGTSSPAVMYPGVHRLRLLGDSANHFAFDSSDASGVAAGKLLLKRPESSRTLTDSIELGAVYILESVPAVEGEPAASRTLLPPAIAAMALVNYTKVGSLLKNEEGHMFKQAAAVVSSTPVYLLRVMRDYSRLDEVVETLFDWHSTSALRSMLVS